MHRNYGGNGSSGHQTEMKNKVLRWLMTQSQHLISSARFPLDEVNLRLTFFLSDLTDCDFTSIRNEYIEMAAKGDARGKAQHAIARHSAPIRRLVFARNGPSQSGDAATVE